jgi:hypothetical protein
MNRRDFLRTSAVLLGGCAVAPGAKAVVGHEYLAAGLAAFSRPTDWSAGHHGAALIAGYYFCRENAIDERTAQSVRRNLDEYVAGLPDAFPARPDGPTVETDRIAETLRESVALYRAGGHDAIYAATALKALRDAPEMAVAPVVDGVCALLRDFVGRFPGRPGCDGYRDDADLARRTCDTILRRGPFRGSGHVVTHADALLTLSECGYPDLARLGYAAHERHVCVREGEAAAREVRWTEASHWDSDAARRPRGSWSVGHAFKFPYSLLRLARRLGDASVARCDLR